MRRDTDLLHDKYFYAAVVLVLLSMAYWCAFSLNAYYTFHDYTDLGEYAENFYYDVSYTGVMNGLQLMVFGNHISLDQLLFVLPIYYLHQSATTLLVVQAAVLCATGLIVFVVTRNLLRDSQLGLLMCIAYLLNPGMHGMMVFDYHIEFLIIPFFVISFYYFMKLNRARYYIALALLLCTIELAPLLVFALGAGMMIYGSSRENESERAAIVRLAAETIVISIAALALFNLFFYVLTASYGTYNSAVPVLFRVQSYPLFPVFSASASGRISIQSFAANMGIANLIAYGLIVAFLGFGVGGLFSAIELVVFSLPWLMEVFFGDMAFALMWFQYFSYVIGGVVAANILGVKEMLKREKRWGLRFAPLRSKPMLVVSTLIVVAFITAVYPFFVLNNNVPDIWEAFIFQTPSSQMEAYSQLYTALALVPNNASLLTQYFVMPHVSDREYLAVLSSSAVPSNFTPQYILVDFNQNISTNVFESNGLQFKIFQQYITGMPYRLVYTNGTAELYKYMPSH